MFQSAQSDQISGLIVIEKQYILLKLQRSLVQTCNNDNLNQLASSERSVKIKSKIPLLDLGEAQKNSCLQKGEFGEHDSGDQTFT